MVIFEHVQPCGGLHVAHQLVVMKGSRHLGGAVVCMSRNKRWKHFSRVLRSMELLNRRARKIPPCVNDVEAEVIAMWFGEELVLVVEHVHPKTAESHCCSHHLTYFQQILERWLDKVNAIKVLQKCAMGDS